MTRNHTLIRSVAALVCGCLGLLTAGAQPATSKASPLSSFVHPDTAPAASWQAQWIGVAQPSSSNQWTCFRKSFSLKSVPATAVARIAADSKYWLWVNGRLVVREGGLKRGPTPSDTYFDEVDLAPHLLRGSNQVGVLVWFFGKEGFSHHSSGQSGFLFQMEADGAQVVSDASWQARVHPAFENTGAPYPNFRLPESNIRFNATKDIPGWEQPGQADTAWPAVVEFGKPDCAPWNRLARRPVPFWKDYGLKRYSNASQLPRRSDGCTIKAWLPYNAQVTPYLKIDAPAGRVIKIQTDNYRGGSEPNVRAEYVTRAGVQEFECLGWMNGHEVHYDIPAGIKVLDLRYRETGFDTDFAGTFTCDDEFLNRLRAKAVRTLYITMRETYMDCPDRERALWWGDAVNELGEAFYALDRRSDSLTRKSVLDLIGWQKPDGTLFAPVPAGNWDKDLPLQMLASVGRTGFWTYGLYSGDLDTLRQVYPGVKRYLESWAMQSNGLVVPKRGAWEWGDWGEHVDMTVLYNAWYHLALQGMKEMAVALHHPEDLPWITKRLTVIESAFNPAFWHGKEYRAPNYKGQTDDRANALAVVAGLAKPEQFPALLEVLKTQEHASPYMEKYVLEAFCRMNAPELAQARIRRRYAKIVNHPVYTTLWEGWGIGSEGFGGGTINHAWSGGPLTIMSQYFAGIAPTAPAFATYQVLPQMGALRQIRANVATVKGDVTVDLRRASDQFALELSSPPGTVATVGIPCADGNACTTVRVNGQLIWRDGVPAKGLDGVQFCERTPEYLLFRTSPGRWKFSATR